MGAPRSAVIFLRIHPLHLGVAHHHLIGFLPKKHVSEVARPLGPRLANADLETGVTTSDPLARKPFTKVCLFRREKAKDRYPHR